jgi:hypothetical protein
MRLICDSWNIWYKMAGKMSNSFTEALYQHIAIKSIYFDSPYLGAYITTLLLIFHPYAFDLWPVWIVDIFDIKWHGKCQPHRIKHSFHLYRYNENIFRYFVIKYISYHHHVKILSFSVWSATCLNSWTIWYKMVDELS